MKRLFFAGLVLALAGKLVMGCSGGDGGGETEEIDTVQQAVTDAPQPVPKTTSKRVFMHLMPWFDAKDTQHGYTRPALSPPYTPTYGSGTPYNTFGKHWTMDNCKAETNGLLNHVCAFDTPLIGPYSSADPFVIEYHLLLMKYAGVDGVVIDWPGVTRYADWPGNRYNAERYIDHLSDFGLTFMIAMEDRNYTDAKNTNQFYNDVTIGASDDLNCLKAGGTCGNMYFGHSQYEKFNNVPVVAVFGPISLVTGTQWATAYSGAGLNPGSTYHISLYDHWDMLGAYNDGTFCWPWQKEYPHLYYQQKYLDTHPYFSIKMAAVYPAFNKYYELGGWPDDATMTPIPSNGGATLAQTFDIALASDVNYIQLVTWNDFGEDTEFEPTVGKGYSILEMTQQKFGVTYKKSDLELIKKLFDERVIARKVGNSARLSDLDQASAYLAALNVSAASSIIHGGALPPSSG